MFPVEEERLTKKLDHYLEIQMEDNVKAHYMQPDGSYEKPDRRGKQAVTAQEVFCEEAEQAAKEQEELTDVMKTRVFVPLGGTEE